MRSRGVLPVVASLFLAGTLAACGGDESTTPKLTWYYNPDNGGAASVAAMCNEDAGGEYRIQVAALPRDSSGQREQLVRRLAAQDSSIDLMSLDVPYVAEFANAGFLRPFTEEEAETLTEGVLEGPVASSMFEDTLYVAPFHANTQLLWYRKSVAEQAGLDPENEPVTWEQVIAAAEETGTTVSVQARRYEGYMVWINALVESGGGHILTNPEVGREVEPGLDTEEGRAAAEIIRSLARSTAAPAGLDNFTEEESRGAFLADNGGFLVNWPYVYSATSGGVADGSVDQAVLDDIAWARYPEMVEGEESRPPIGGINVGIGAFTDFEDVAVDAITCITSVEGQKIYMLSEGNPAASEEVYDDPEVREAFPMADLIAESLDAAAPRPQSPFYNDVSQATVREFHPPRSVDPDRTPADAAKLIVDVLNDKVLL